MFLLTVYLKSVIIVAHAGGQLFSNANGVLMV